PIGAGIINAKAAVDAAGGGGGGPVDPPPGGRQLASGVPVTGITGAASGTQYWTITAPAGAATPNIATSGATRGVSMSLRRGSPPTTTTSDCRPYRAGNAESGAFTDPRAGTWHVMLRGYSAYSGVSLVGTYVAGGGGGG